MPGNKVGLITYASRHLKTEQVAVRLANVGEFEITVFGLPFEKRAPRKTMFQHRPDQFESVQAPDQMMRGIGGQYKYCATEDEIDSGLDVYLVLCGRILGPNLLSRIKVLNCHAGIIPLIRGLDAFKWAVLEGTRLGVTLHYIDAEVDRGEVVTVVPTSVMAGDTLETLSLRHYQNEIDVLANFEYHMRNPSPFQISAEIGWPHLRMSQDSERDMVAAFPAFLKKWAEATI
jgi:phosphoribosylglycinamide formyltransferase-1